MVYGPFLNDRRGGNLIFLINKVNPATGAYFDNVAVTAVAFRLLDPTTTPAGVLLTTTAGVWDSVAQQWKLTTPYSNVAGKQVVLVEVVPTRAGGTAAALWPEVRVPIDVSDIRQEQDDDEAAILADSASKTTAINATTNAARDNVKAEVDTQAAATNAILNNATYGLSAIKTLLSSVASYLTDPEFGLAALDADIDAILADLGATADPPGTVTTGSVNAKLNAALTLLTTITGSPAGLSLDFGP